MNDGAPLPPGTCLTAAAADFQIKTLSSGLRDVRWKWRKGEAFAQSDLGNPEVDTPYALCIFDRSAGVPRLVASVAIDPNQRWVSKAPKGYTYKDADGLDDGVSNARFKTGADGRTAAQINAKGANLPAILPFGTAAYFDQDPRVTVELRNGSGACWSTEFVSESTRLNDGGRFKAKAP